MVYYGTLVSEKILFHYAGDFEDMHYIEMGKSIDEPVFYVSCCCDPHWFYEFKMESNSDYERVKYCIMETIFECDEMDELLDVLGDRLNDGFYCLLNEHECDGCCEHCNEKNNLN